MTASLPPASPERLIGQELAGRYRIVEMMAEGGMATVYRARERGAARDVALKVLHADLARDRTFALRFEREASLVGQLVHPRIVRLFDHGTADGVYYMAMELLEGEDLFGILERARMLQEAVARRIVIEVCEALSEAHGLGIVHRDMKLENVFVTRGPHGEASVKLLDFGVAKMREPDGKGSDAAPVLTAIGALLGTPEYMAPEHCRGDAPGPLADVYACGVLLYVLLTGRAPFMAPRPVDVILKQISEAPTPASVLRPDIHPALDMLILQALAKEPRERPQSASAFAEALRLVGPAPALTAELLGLPPARPPAPAPRREPEVDPDARTQVAMRIDRLTTDLDAPVTSEAPPPPSPAAAPPPAAASNTRPPPASWQLAALLAALLIGAVAGRLSTLLWH